jgi:glucosyl-dolichyl phosphate glucuronosyltransferase
MPFGLAFGRPPRTASGRATVNSGQSSRKQDGWLEVRPTLKELWETMKTTVIMCTYNRCQSMAKALSSVAASMLPDSVKWEVVVVDNNSSDQTREVVEDFCRRHPGRFRYVFEPQQGLSHARNAGIREAQGDILAFTDDDVTVEPTWLQNLTARLNDGEWAGTGGRTFLAQPFSPPPWLGLEEPYNLGGALAALFDLGDRPCRLARAPYGANMAFQKKMFEKYGAFRTDLDRCGTGMLSNGDTEFGRRLLDAGERLSYEPSAIVYHPVPEHRTQQSYFLTWYFNYGRATVREWRRGPDILRIPRRCFTFFKLIGTVLPVRTLRWIVARQPQRRFFYRCWTWVTVGQVLEIYRQGRNAKGQKIYHGGQIRDEDHRHPVRT